MDKRKWFRVNLEDCFCDDMDGVLIGTTDKTYLLEFNLYLGTHRVMFYKDQLKFIGEF